MAQDTAQRPDAILDRIKALKEADSRKVIRTRSRRAKVREEYVGHTLGVFNGQGYTNVHITKEMVKRELGKLAPRVRPTAQAKFLSIPPRKMRLVGELIKGQPVEKALNILNFTPKIAALHMAKVLKAAAANMLSEQGTANLQAEDLVVATVVVGAGPSAKRIQYRSMGRIYRIRKRYCHLAIYLDIRESKRQEVAEAEREAKGPKTTRKPTAKKTAAKKTAAKKKTPAKKTAAKKKTTAKKTAAKKTAAKKTTAKKTAEPKATKKSGAEAGKEKKK